MRQTDDIIKYIAGCIDSENKEKILSDIEKDPEAENVYNKIKVASAFLSSENKMQEYKIEKSFQKLQEKINLQSHPSAAFKLRTVIKYAAILFLILGISSLMFYIKNQLTSEKNLRYTSIVARYKQISQVILPDSSIVWLNSGTTLTYNNNYSFNNRDISIKGEAYFDVKKNKQIPLIVSCNDLKVKVLGTKFNVSAYPEDQDIMVALKEGSVELLNTKNKSFNYRLKPGEIAQYNIRKKEVAIKETNVEDFAVWKDGLLVFKDTPMDEVIKKLKRKFNINIIVENPATVYEPAFNATFKDENLIEILNYIQYSCHIKYEIIKEKTNTTVKLY